MKKTFISLIVLFTVLLMNAQSSTAQLLCTANFQYVVGPTTPNGTNIFFYDSSSSAGTITSWSWTFNTGQVSSLQNPIISVGVGGATIVACLTITAQIQGINCTSTYCDTIVVNGTPPPCNPAFTFTVNPSGVSFAAVAGTNVSWQWSFGDGTGGTGQNITHTYAAPGTYQACLTVVNANGVSCTSCQTVVVTTSSGCNAAFTSAPIPGTTLIQFTNQSSGNPTGFSWSFGDGTGSTLEDPTHAYNGVGPYVVCLTVTDSVLQCTDTYCDTIYLNNSGPCQASFNFTVAPLGVVAFTNTSNAPSGTTYIWDFGDGTTSTQQSPTHTYAASGTYYVCLTIINQNLQCYNTYCANVIVGSVFSCQAAFSWYPDSSGTGIQFVNTSSGSPTNYQWTFGNGTTSTQQNPFVAYSTPGWYYVCLSIWTVNGTCQSSTCDSVYFSGQGGGCSSNFALYPDTLTPHNYFAINLATGVAPITYLWSWGDGTSSTGAYPSHTYAGPGLYTICLTITDGAGCTSTTCYQWQLLRLSGISAPVTINVIPGPTGISEPATISLVSLYPNPASDWLTANFTLAEKSSVNVKGFNMAGQCIINSPSSVYNAGQHEISVDVSQVPQGVYMIEIQTDKSVMQQKVIIQ